MQLTNTLGLPDVLAEAVAQSMAKYDRGEAIYSVSELISPTQITILKRRHAEDIVEDVSDNLWSLMGTAMHNILEEAGVRLAKNTEPRLFADIEGLRISGAIDYAADDGILYDWKFVSVWEVMHGVKKEREEQLNCYAHLARLNGWDITGLRVGFIFRDWSKSQAAREKEYPQKGAVMHDLRLWGHEEAHAFIATRLHALGLQYATGEMHCSEEERWHKDDKWAVMKAGNKKASRVLPSETEALDWALNGKLAARHPQGHIMLNNGIGIEHRPGEDTRCELYCAAAPFCPQFKEAKKSAVSV
jgi:hypothetical protein